MSAQSPTNTTVYPICYADFPSIEFTTFPFLSIESSVVYSAQSPIKSIRIDRGSWEKFEWSSIEQGGEGCSNLPDPFEPGFTRWILGTFKCGVHWKARTYSPGPCACVYFARVVALYLWNALFYCAREMSALLSLVPLFEQPRDNIVPSLIRHRSWTSHIVIRGGLCSRSTHLDSQPAIALILA